jgi:ankyrin repeat protein
MRKRTTRPEQRTQLTCLRACDSGKIKVVEKLLKAGLSPDFVHEDTGDTPLRSASAAGHLPIVRLLLRAGADPNLAGNWKADPPYTTPLEMAACRGRLDVARLLIRSGADINLKGYFTPLKAAASCGQPKLVRFLLLHGAQVERGTLHLAVRSGQLPAVLALIKAGADLNARNSDGQTPLHFSAWKDSGRIAEALIAAGAKVDVKTRYTKETPLHVAAQRGKTQVVEALTKAGAETNLRGWKKKTAEQWARAFGHLELAKFLRDWRSDASKNRRY